MIKVETNADMMTLDFGGERVLLTRAEFAIVQTLSKRPNMIFDRFKLIAAVWFHDADLDPRMVDTHIKRLRRKMRAADFPACIHTRYAFGYYWEQKKPRVE